MPKVHIVGRKYSFTYNACTNRYPNGYSFDYHEQTILVTLLLERKIPLDEPSIVPLWNSNTGTIDMDEKKVQTAKILLGEAGNIVDLWPEEIIYELGVQGNGQLFVDCDIYSVKVANDQCSRFLQTIGVRGSERFKPRPTTTDAAKAFLDSARQGDGLLCSSELLNDNGFTPKGNQANPFNMTVFSTINLLPVQVEKQGNIYSLACILTEVNGNNLSTDFVDYWKNLFSEQAAEQTKDLLLEMPKIVFILRYEGSKALLLLEMPSPDFSENPWPAPDIDVDSSGEMRSDIISCEQVGGIFESYVATERSLFLNNFKQRDIDVIFYGSEKSFLWGSPALNIFVHGYDPSLVKECARLQVVRLRDLMNYGIPMSQSAQEILKRFETNPGSVLLSVDSQPHTV